MFSIHRLNRLSFYSIIFLSLTKLTSILLHLILIQVNTITDKPTSQSGHVIHEVIVAFFCLGAFNSVLDTYLKLLYRCELPSHELVLKAFELGGYGGDGLEEDADLVLVKDLRHMG